jgi:hypothetical protein
VRVGSELAGFEVLADETGAVFVRAWGFWDVEVANQFGDAVVGALEGKPNVPQVVMDMSELRPMREEGQDSFGRVVKTLSSRGISRVTVATTSQLVRLQLIRLANANAPKGFVEFTTETNQHGRQHVRRG